MQVCFSESVTQCSSRDLVEYKESKDTHDEGVLKMEQNKTEKDLSCYWETLSWHKFGSIEEISLGYSCVSTWHVL